MGKWKRSQMRAIRFVFVITISLVFMLPVGLVVASASPQEREMFLTIIRRVVLG